MKRANPILLFVITLFLPACANAFYKVIDLSTLGGDLSEAYSINDNGQIVGWTVGSSGYPRAVLFDATGMGKNVGLAGADTDSMALSINNSGQITGFVFNRLGFCRATLFDSSDGGNNIDLGEGIAYSINDSHQVVGCLGVNAALFELNTGRNVILCSSGESYATSVNEKGQIVGCAPSISGGQRATLFDPTGNGNNIDLGSFPGCPSEACSINDSGQIVGWEQRTREVYHAILFDPTGSGNNIDLGEGFAYSINNSGQIVGNWRGRAALFDPTGKGSNIDLNTLIDPASGWSLFLAYSINDSGWIVGTGLNPDGEFHAYLLIPEPTSLLLFGLGVLCLRKRRKMMLDT